MIIDSVLDAARPYLEDSFVTDLVVGISLIAVELDRKNVGVSYVLRENLEAGCSIFPYVRDVIGQKAADIAAWAKTGGDDLQRAIGVAVLTAASERQALEDSEAPTKPFGVAPKSHDTLGMVGYVPAVRKMLGSMVKQTYVFDEGISLRGGADVTLLPMQEQALTLPKCDIVVISGTSIINRSLDALLRMCANAREVVIIGSSTPMYPEAFSHTPVTVLAGSWWKHTHKSTIFRDISLASGISELGKSSIKMAVRVLR